MKIGRRIYYDIATGNVLIDTGERQGDVSPTTVNQDIQTYQSLHSRLRESYDYTEFEYGEYAQDFTECSGYRVNPTTRKIEFSYEPIEGSDEPLYREPLSVEVIQLKNENEQLKNSLADLWEVVLLGGIE